MKKILALIALSLTSIIGFSQVASRILSTQSNPQLISAPNFIWVDNSPGAMNRLWVASADSLKIQPFQLTWFNDSVINKTSLLYKPLSWFPTWSEVTSKPTFSLVANTGQYNDLLNRPTLFNGNYNDLTNKPVLFSGSYLDLINIPTIFPTNIASVSGLTAALNNKITIGATIPYTTISGTPTLSTVATTGNYNDLNGLPSLFSGSYIDLTNKPTVFPTDISNVSGLTTALNNKITVGTSIPYSTITGTPTIPAAQVNSDWNSVSGVSQILNKPIIPTNTNQLTNGANFITASGAPVQSVNGQTGIVTLSIPAAQIQSDWNQTANTAVDFIKNKPIIPTNTNQLTNGSGFITGITGAQVNSALGYTPYNSTNPSNYISRTGVSAGTGITYDNTTGVITNSAPDQTVVLNSGTGVSVSGTYPNFTISSTIAAPTINSAVSRTVNNNYTISTTRMANVNYSINITVTNPLLIGTSTGTAFLEYSTNGGTTWVTVSQISNTSGVGVTVTLALTTGGSMILSGTIPANALTRIRTTTSGTASVTYITGQEILN